MVAGNVCRYRVSSGRVELMIICGHFFLLMPFAYGCRFALPEYATLVVAKCVCIGSGTLNYKDISERCPVFFAARNDWDSGETASCCD